MSTATNGHATHESSATKTVEQLQTEMVELLKEFSGIEKMTPIERQVLQAQFELKSLEIRRQILLAEHDDVVAQLPELRNEVQEANAAVAQAQERHRDALGKFSNLDERRRRLAIEADQLLRDCEGVRLKMP